MQIIPEKGHVCYTNWGDGVSRKVAEREASNDVEIRYALKAFEFARLEYEEALESNRLVSGAVPDIEVRLLKLAADRTKLQIEQAQHRHAVARLKAKEARARLDAFRKLIPTR